MTVWSDHLFLICLLYCFLICKFIWGTDSGLASTRRQSSPSPHPRGWRLKPRWESPGGFPWIQYEQRSHKTPLKFFQGGRVLSYWISPASFALKIINLTVFIHGRKVIYKKWAWERKTTTNISLAESCYRKDKVSAMSDSHKPALNAPCTAKKKTTKKKQISRHSQWADKLWSMELWLSSDIFISLSQRTYRGIIHSEN